MLPQERLLRCLSERPGHRRRNLHIYLFIDFTVYDLSVYVLVYLYFILLIYLLVSFLINHFIYCISLNLLAHSFIHLFMNLHILFIIHLHSCLSLSNQIKSNQIYLTTQKSKINKQMKMKK